MLKMSVLPQTPTLGSFLKPHQLSFLKSPLKSKTPQQPPYCGTPNMMPVSGVPWVLEKWNKYTKIKSQGSIFAENIGLGKNLMNLKLIVVNKMK
jgi:hypothetical protein